MTRRTIKHCSEPRLPGAVDIPLSLTQRIVRGAFLGLVGMAILYILLALTVGVNVVHNVPVENDPLKSSIGVASISGNRLTLVDGRVIEMSDSEPEQLERSIRESGNRVEMESIDSSFVKVTVKKKIFICGGTSRPLIDLPLVRREYAANGRHSLGFGNLQ